MLFTPHTRENLRPLKALIKGCAEESCRMRQKKINKLAGEKRQVAQLEKIRLGIYTRHYQLAYGFLRGLEYKQIEQKSNGVPISGWKGSLSTAVEYIDLTAIFNVVVQHSPQVAWSSTFTKTDVEKWLKGERYFLTPEQAKAKMEHEKKLIGKWVMPV